MRRTVAIALLGQPRLGLRGENLAGRPVAHILFGNGLRAFGRFRQQAMRARIAKARGRIAGRIGLFDRFAGDQMTGLGAAEQGFARRRLALLAHLVEALQQALDLGSGLELNDQFLGDGTGHVHVVDFLVAANRRHGLDAHQPVDRALVQSDPRERLLGAPDQGMGLIAADRAARFWIATEERNPNRPGRRVARGGHEGEPGEDESKQRGEDAIPATGGRQPVTWIGYGQFPRDPNTHLRARFSAGRGLNIASGARRDKVVVRVSGSRRLPRRAPSLMRLGGGSSRGLG